MAEFEEVCFVCEQTLSKGNTIVVKEKGLNTLRKCSKQREDGKSNRELVNLQTACRKYYINPKLFTSSKRMMITETDDPCRADAPSTSRRSIVPPFDFKTRCFLCDTEITEEYLMNLKKTKISDRDKVYEVRTIEMKKKLLTCAENRQDDWGRTVANRLANIYDLVAVEGRYHHSCFIKFHRAPYSEKKRGFRPAANVDEAMESIYNYLEENSDECQFSLEELMDLIEGDYRPDTRTIQARLLKKYGDDIIIAHHGNRSGVVCFRNMGSKILMETWYGKKRGNLQEERLRIVKAAATIVLEDIRSQVYETTEYPPSVNFMHNVDTVVPETLRTFLDNVIFKHKRGSLDKWRIKSTAVAHSIIAAARPKSFLSPLQIGVGAFLHTKFGSRQLVDVISSLGFCASYAESVLFQTSAIMRPPIEIESGAFSQFIFDNADFNTNTLDGLNTFHAMGGIHCITPGNAITPDKPIPRLKKMPTAKVIGAFGNIPIQTFRKNHEAGLKMIIVQDLQSIHPINNEVFPSSSDFLWLYGKSKNVPSIPGWNGFMEDATSTKPFERSRIVCLPFINAPPSDYDTILTSLLSAAKKCHTLKQKTCFVTFDQPLYIKARDIIASNFDPVLNNVIPILGGFHMLMSFMGAIGYIMAGSGLKQLMSTIYAEQSVDKMLSGHAYTRAVRAHILCHVAVAKIVWQAINLTDDEIAYMSHLLCASDRSIILTIEQSESYTSIVRKFKEQLSKLEANGPTAKLWAQYFRMVTIMKQFIEAERSANWQLHLETMQKMLPYFHATGHFLYAKSCQLHLQDMLALKDNMNPIEYDRFTTQGYFTIRRSNKFWSGIWTDMTIEQTLMRTMKTAGGLTRGRGISDSVLTMWTLGMVYLHNICDQIEDFCAVSLHSTDQHVDMKPSRIIRDTRDIDKLMDWLSQHNPFPEVNVLMSISTGTVGEGNTNCHQAHDIGTLAMAKMIGHNFESVKFKRKDRVLSLATARCSVNIASVPIVINPMLLFQRMCIAKKTDEELRDYFHFELAPFPMSLFTEEGMRKGTKSSLYKAYTPITPIVRAGTSVHVLDGGFLLHRVIWGRQNTFETICCNYIRYIERHYGSNTIVIFDGYPNNPANTNTKSSERDRRSKQFSGTDVFFDESMIPTLSQERFLSNSSNKKRLISLLKIKLEERNYTVKQTIEDADYLIIQTAVEISPYFSSVFVVGEDVDLLVLMTAMARDLPNVYLQKPARGKKDEVFYSSKSLQYSDTVAKNILFLHAFSGCDTTSALFNQGKVKFLNTLEKSHSLNDALRVFEDSDAHLTEIIAAGESFLLKQYGGGTENICLDSLRYKNFVRLVSKNAFNISALPPTSDACQQHSLRTYYQVQKWHGIQKNPEEYGWRRTSSGLDAIRITKEPAPDVLLKSISCKCQKGCGAACGCRKAGLKCSVLCLYCNGTSCENIPDHSQDEEDDIAGDPDQYESADSVLELMADDDGNRGESVESNLQQHRKRLRFV